MGPRLSTGFQLKLFFIVETRGICCVTNVAVLAGTNLISSFVQVFFNGSLPIGTITQGNMKRICQVENKVYHHLKISSQRQ